MPSSVAAGPRHCAFIGLGANLGEAEQTLKSAVNGLRQLAESRITAVSSLYRSAPLGPAGQPDYLNAVACLDTALTPHALLAALQALEKSHGRRRELRWGARTLDLDILLYANDVISSPDLVVPHVELKNRNFCVIPLLELQPDLHLPDATVLAELPCAKSWQGIKVVSRHWAGAEDQDQPLL